MKEKEIWTIGHSPHPITDFIAMLKSFYIQTLVDVRSFSGSPKFPQYEGSIGNPHEGKQNLLSASKRSWRKKKTSKVSKNPAWKLASFRGYADHTETFQF